MPCPRKGKKRAPPGHVAKGTLNILYLLLLTLCAVVAALYINGAADPHATSIVTDMTNIFR